MSTETNEVLTLIIAIGALAVGAYGAWLARRAGRLADRIAERTDALEFLQNRFEVVRTALAQQALQIRQETALSDLRFRARKVLLLQLSDTSREQMKTVIAGIDAQLASTRAAIASGKEIVETARGLTANAVSSPEANRAAAELLETIRTSSAELEVLQAMNEGIIAEADNALIAAQF